MSKMKELWEHLTDWEKSPIAHAISEWRIKKNIRDLDHKDPLWRPVATSRLNVLMSEHEDRDWSDAVPALVKALKDPDQSVRVSACIGLETIAKRHPEYDWNDALATLLGEMNRRDFRGWSFAAKALYAMPLGPRDHSDLKLIRGISAELRKMNEERGGMSAETAYIMLLYTKWSRMLNARADALVSDKRFPLPKIEPDGVDRILRMRRLRA